MPKRNLVNGIKCHSGGACATMPSRESHYALNSKVAFSTTLVPLNYIMEISRVSVIRL